MIVHSFLTLIILEIIVIITIAIGVFLLKKIPPKEMYLLVLCLIFEFLTYFFYSINFYFSTATKIDSGTIIYSRIAYFLSQLAILAITYAFMLIDFKYSYINIFELVLFSWIGIFNASYNALTVQSHLVNGTIQSIYSPIGELLIIIFLSSVIFIWIRRFLQISKIYGKIGDSTKFFRSLFLFIVIGLFFMFIYVVSAIVYHYEGDTTFITSGFFTIVGTIALYKNNAFLFITDIKLDSILIIEKNSAIILYSKFFDENETTKNGDPDYISSVISAINISFSNTIKSQKELAEMNFSDKTVLIYSGEVVSSIVIVSSGNLIAKSISQFIVKRFENIFGQEILKKVKDNSFLGRKKDYSSFDNEITYVRKFLPL